MPTSEFSTGKTIFIFAIVVGCFAILWPKIFYPMLQASLNVYSPPAKDDSELCCDVVYESESDANLRILSELCNKVLRIESKTQSDVKRQQRSWSEREGTLELCREEIVLQCGIDINEALMDDKQHAKQYKAAMEGLRSFNVTKCLRIHFGFDEKVLGSLQRVRKRINHLYIPQHMRQERPSYLHPEYMHPALREKGRAIPPQRTMEKYTRPGPLPGMRPPMGGAGQVVPPPKSSGTMGIIMPIYTIGIVLFFMYTMMKVLFKKPEEQDRTPKIKDFHMDPEHRRFVFPEEYTDGEASYREYLRRKESLERRGRSRTEELENTKIVEVVEEASVEPSQKELDMQHPADVPAEMKRDDPVVSSSEEQLQENQISKEDKEVELIFEDNLGQGQEALSHENQTLLTTLGQTLEDLEIDQLRRRLEETERAMERIMAQMGSVSNKLSPSVMEQALTDAQLGKEGADQKDAQLAGEVTEDTDRVAPTLGVRGFTAITPDDQSDMPVEHSQQVDQLISKQDSAFTSEVPNEASSYIPNLPEAVETSNFHREEEDVEEELAILVDIDDSEAQDMKTACDISEALDGTELEAVPEIIDEEIYHSKREIDAVAECTSGVAEHVTDGETSELKANEGIEAFVREEAETKAEDKIKQEENESGGEENQKLALLEDIAVTQTEESLKGDQKTSPIKEVSTEIYKDESKVTKDSVDIQKSERVESPKVSETARRSLSREGSESKQAQVRESTEIKRSLSRESSETKTSFSREGSESRRGKPRSGSSRESSDDSRIAVLGMEVTVGVEGGKKWSKDHSPTPERKKISRSPTPTGREHGFVKETELRNLPFAEDKRRGTPEIPIKDEDVSSVFLEASLPSETQLIVAEAQCQAEAVPLEELELDESEYDTAPVVLSGKMTLSVIGMEHVTDEQTDEGEALPKDSLSPYEQPVSPLSAEGSDTPTAEDFLSADGHIPGREAQETLLSDVSLETDNCEMTEGSERHSKGYKGISSSTTQMLHSKSEAADEFVHVSAKDIPVLKSATEDAHDYIQIHAGDTVVLSTKPGVGEELTQLAAKDATVLPSTQQTEEHLHEDSKPDRHQNESEASVWGDGEARIPPSRGIPEQEENYEPTEDVQYKDIEVQEETADLMSGKRSSSCQVSPKIKEHDVQLPGQESMVNFLDHHSLEVNEHFEIDKSQQCTQGDGKMEEEVDVSGEKFTFIDVSEISPEFAEYIEKKLVVPSIQSALKELGIMEELNNAMAETAPEHGTSEGSSDFEAYDQGMSSSRGSSLPSQQSESSEVEASCTDESTEFATVSATAGEETVADLSAVDTFCDTEEKQESQDIQQPVEIPTDTVAENGAKIIVSNDRCQVEEIHKVPQTLPCGEEQKASVLRVSQSSSGESSNFEIVGGSNGDSSSFEQVNGSPFSLSPVSPIAESELETESDTVVSLQSKGESSAGREEAGDSVTKEEQEGSSVTASGSSETSWMFFFL